jgi:outer membrane lipoprotein-sorting protein
MAAWRGACALLVLCVSTTRSGAEQKPPPWQPIVRLPAAQPSPGAQQLTEHQVNVVQRVNSYFNQLGLLEGSFVQTASDGKRQRGMLHIQRPGRFRFEFAPPSRVVIISDGRNIAVQDYDLNTDDRQDLRQSPFRPLLDAKVDLLRDAVISSVSDSDGTILIGLKGSSAEAASITLVLAANPLRLKGWIAHDNQNLDTKVDLTEIKVVDRIDARLFDPSSRLERRQW